jgi:hypothetical protein
MKTMVQRRLALLAGLLLLSLLVIAVGAQVVQALRVSDSGASSGSGAVAVTTAPAKAEGRGGASAPLVPAAGVQPASSTTTSTTTSTTAWIVAGSVAAALIVGLAAWALVRRRRQYGVPGSAAYCSRHPDDALCGVA